MAIRKTGNQKRKYSFNRYEDIDKCIWKVFDNFGHDEKIENLVYWTKKLQKERAIFRKKAVKYDELQSILEEYNVTPEILREVLLTGQMFRNQPTLDECIKEWEDAGYELINDYCRDFHFVKKIENTIYNRPIYHHFVIERINGGRYFAYSSFEKDDNFNHRQYFVISFEEHNLIYKTLKALEGMKNENS